MRIALQEKPIQPLFSNKSEGVQNQPLEVNLCFVISTSSINKAATFSNKKRIKRSLVYMSALLTNNTERLNK